jgi:hypothetical protein
VVEAHPSPISNWNDCTVRDTLPKQALDCEAGYANQSCARNTSCPGSVHGHWRQSASIFPSAYAHCGCISVSIERDIDPGKCRWSATNNHDDSSSFCCNGCLRKAHHSYGNRRPISATVTITFIDGSTSIGSASLTSGKGMLALSTLSVGSPLAECGLQWRCS